MSASPPITLIVAADRQDGIARLGELPWHLPLDLARFKRLTIGSGRSAVLMGRVTWDTLPPRWQPLPERMNLVLTRSEGAFRGARRVGSWDEALAACRDAPHPVDHLWVVGGATIYALALAQPGPMAIELTRIDADYDCDVRWPGVPADFVRTAREPHAEKGVGYAFERWERAAPGSTTSAQMP